MPPSVACESLERQTSFEESIYSTHSLPPRLATMTFPSEAAQNNTRSHSMDSPKFAKQFSHYGNDSDYEEDDDGGDGCGDISLFERPTWFQSLQRLRRCCPGVPSLGKIGVEHRVRTHSESTASSKTSSRQESPVAPAAAPAYQWGVPPPHLQYPMAPHQGWYPPPSLHGYPAPYPPNAYAAWGYPSAPMNNVNYNNMPPLQQQPNVMMYPSPPTGTFHNKTYGYNGYEPSMPIRKNTAPESFQSPMDDSGTESDVSRSNSHRQQNKIATSKQRQVVKPPRVQRRSTAPAQSSSPFPSVHKEVSKDQSATAHPPLPPKQPSRKNVFNSRPRLPSEMSRTSVGTASSRHRRQAHETFEFSTNSLTEIAREGPIPVGPPPLNFIEVQPLQRTCSWSSWDDQTHHDDDTSLLLSPDEDDITGYISPIDDENKSPARLKNEAPPADWMVEWAKEGKTTIEPPSSPVSRASKLSEAPRVPTKETTTGPVYLPVSEELDAAVQDAGSCLIVSGWAAMSEGDALRNSLALAEGNEIRIQRDNICYLQLVREGSKCSLKIHFSDKEVKVVTLTRSLQALSQEVSGRAGRCVLLQDGWTRQVLWTILPVSLPSHFFRDGRLVSARHFPLLQSIMFTPFYNATTGNTTQEWSQEYIMRRYAPDAQHDAAMHILFCIDAALSSTATQS